MSKASHKRKIKAQEMKLVAEGRARQAKYAKMNDITKCGHTEPTFNMLDKLKDQKIFKRQLYSKGQISEVIELLK